MKVGDILTVEIISMGMDGEGVARVDGVVLFVHGALIGETVKVQITQVKKSFCFAKVIKLLVASSDRVEPKCKIGFKCGGCETLHIDYKKQLEIKRQHVKNCLEKQCKRDFIVDETVASPKQVGYRNKIQVPISCQDGKLVGGYYAPNSHKVVAFCKQGDGGSCLLNSDGMQEIIDAFLDYMNSQGISAYDENSHSGLARHLVIRKVDGKFAICVVINGNNLPKREVLISMLNSLGIEFSLYISPNTRRTNVIMGEKVITLFGEESLQGEALGVKYLVSPQSFMQINDDVRDMIYSRVGEIIRSSGINNVIDAYSGIGIMSNIFAKYADKVYAIEIVPQAIANSEVLAKLNGNSDKIINICGDCAQELPKVVARLEKSIVVIDPPRKGCDKAVLSALLSALPDQIIYISCNPSTLARDIDILLDKYEPTSITPYDMFPNTKHIETLICLKRKQPK
ncbi:MAG: 23S rRNA (uracil(1939)-C(5))-methyltransferase RlmD [Clostridia bacterium]|nr:23S rRNA (uracil(1939)-C(5))-methyltransferase RlmD [Clostridia bacterium]